MSMLLRRAMMSNSSNQAYAMWNPSDKTNITLSGSNLTAAATTGGSTTGVRGSIGVASGKWYWEIARGASGSATTYIGIANSTHSLGSGTSANNVIQSSSGAVYVEGSYVAPGTSGLVNNDVLGIALDATAKTLIVYVNGVNQGTWSYTLSGSVFPFYGCLDNSSGNSCTANFGATPFKYTIPGGYNPGLF